MKNLKVIYTEIGEILVIVSPIIENGEILYNGSIVGENNIFIQTKTVASCLEQLKKSFELSMHFWVRFELSDIGLNYEGKVKKDWYNGN